MVGATPNRCGARSEERTVRRLFSPIGFALALACFWLPFLLGGSASPNPIATVAPSITYTGFDLALGGSADVLIPEWRPDSNSYDPVPVSDELMYGHPQQQLAGSVYGVVALVLIGVGILASLIPVGRARAIVSAAAALLGALAVLALEAAQRREVARLLTPLLGYPATVPPPVQFVSLRAGFWIAMTFLVVIGLAHVIAAVPAQTAPAPTLHAST